MSYGRALCGVIGLLMLAVPVAIAATALVGEFPCGATLLLVGMAGGVWVTVALILWQVGGVQFGVGKDD